MKIQLTIISDGRAGNDAQSLGLAEGIGRLAPVEIDIRPVALTLFGERLPQVMLGWGRARPGGWPFTAFQDPGALEGVKADLVIGAGRRPNLAVRALKQAHGLPGVAILKPGLPLKDYDLVIVPRHDGVRGGNVIQTFGAMNRITPGKIADGLAQVAEGWRNATRPVVVLVGGGSRSAKFDLDVLNRLMSDIRGFANQGFTPLVVPSPRTPDWAARMLTKAFAHVWDRAAPNPYPGVLGLAEAIIVTQDSVNMASEAASTGKPLFVSGEDKVAGKFLSFHADLRTRCGARDAADGPADWAYEPLAEADRVAAEVCARLGVIR